MEKEASAFSGSIWARKRHAVLILLTGLTVAATPMLSPAQNVTVAWNANPTNQNIIGYTLYYGFDGTTYPGQVNAATNSVTVSNLPAGSVVYFTVTARDVFHSVSPPSTPLGYFVVERLMAGSNSVDNTVGTVVVSNSNNSFSLLSSGDGTLLPKRAGSLYQTGKTFTLTAAPAKGWVVSDWVSNGVVVSTTAKYTFTVETNLAVQANFVTNPFVPVAGSYHGLFFPTNNATEENSGAFAAVVAGSGQFSAKLSLNGVNEVFTGQFSAGGLFTKTLSHPGTTPLTVQLELGVTTNSAMTGTVSDGDWTADLVADPATFSKSNPAPQAGKYTLVFPGSTNGSAEPAGNGFGAVSVTSAGVINFSGLLADGTPVNCLSAMASDGSWPFYVSLYSGKGSVMGWLSFTNDAITGQVGWIKPPLSASKYYPAGFTNTIQVLASSYEPTNGTPVLGYTQGTLWLTGADLGATVTNQVTLSANNEISDSANVKVSVKSATGIFKGTVLNPATGTPITVNGVVLQNQGSGAGYFLEVGESGSVVLSSAQ